MGGSFLDLSQQSVMIVDDNRHMRALLCSIFRALKIKNLKEVGDGETALLEIEAFEPTLVVTDWHMEPMDGISLVKNIRHSAFSSVKYVPIIMLTGHSDLHRVQEARDSGVHEFMAKPVAAKDLLKRLEAIVGHPRPFIENDSYFGPDRRRKNQGPPPGSSERRDAGGTASVASDDTLSPEQALAS